MVAAAYFAAPAIVGSGFTGMRAALELARAGRSVLVLDKDAAGAGALGVDDGRPVHQGGAVQFDDREVLGEVRSAPPRARQAEQRQGSSRPALEGLKVLDFTWAYAGPAATRYLTDFGATVIRVESAKKLDALRTVAPFKDGHAGVERSGAFINANIGKYGLSLNLSASEAREIAMRLVKWADVVIENFSPKAMRAWGMASTGKLLPPYKVSTVWRLGLVRLGLGPVRPIQSAITKSAKYWPPQ